MTGYLAFVEAAGNPAAPNPSIAESVQEYDAAGFHWVGIDKLEKELVLPSAFKGFYQTLRKSVI